MPVQSYAIVAGWNNSGTLVNIESIDPSPAKYLNDILGTIVLDANTSYLVTSTPIQQNRVQTPNGSVPNGNRYQQWLFELISDDALSYWRTNFVGLMTVTTKVSDVYDTYANYNAIADHPFVTRDQRFYECETWWYHNVIVPVYLKGGAS